MNVNDYCTYIRDNDVFFKSRLLIVPDNHNRQLLRDFYKNSTEACIVRISDSINENAFLPMPNIVFANIKEAIREINQDGKIAYIIGLDGYSSLLNSESVSIAYELLRDVLDDQEYKVVFLAYELNIQSFNEIFSNPRYTEGRTIIRVGEDNRNSNKQYAITFVGSAWLTHAHPYESSIKSFLNKFEDEILADNEVRISVQYNRYPFAGLNPSVHQVYSLESFMHVFYGVDQNLSEQALNWIHMKIVEWGGQGNALNSIQHYFYSQGLQGALITAPRDIINAQEAEQEVLIWMLKESIPINSYLHKVLNNSNLNKSTFVMCYVCQALDLLTDFEASRYSKERSAALKEMGHENLGASLSYFIEQCKDKPIEQVAVWLNNGIQSEKHELVRRIMAEQAVEIPPSAIQAYPLLGDYLAEYKLGSEALNDYFTLYRTQKLKNHVLEEFCNRASEEILPEEIKSRDAIVQQYVSDSKTALLIVDAMGAEYIPMLLALAKKRGVGIQSMEVGYAKLPSSTEFNSIIWPSERKLQEIKQIDNIIHLGAEGHVTKQAEENFVALLEEIDKRVLPAVSDALPRFDRVVLTADHGASRLAVCAYIQNLTKTIDLPEEANIKDWRYSTSVNGQNVPDGVISSFDDEYWVVKGYNRFAKSGGKYHELHGGATIEERLVPIIVFKQGASFVPKVQQRSKSAEFVENDEFDF